MQYTLVRAIRFSSTDMPSHWQDTNTPLVLSPASHAADRCGLSLPRSSVFVDESTSPSAGDLPEQTRTRTLTIDNILLYPCVHLTNLLITSTLLDTLNESSINSLCFHIPASCDPIPTALRSHKYNSLRLSYGGPTSTLRIVMPTPLHEAVQCVASEILTSLNKRRNADVIIGTTQSFCLPSSLYVHGDTNDGNMDYHPPHSNTGIKRKPAGIKRKPTATSKTPDYAFRPKHSIFPTIVFEAGWTESPYDLACDAMQWLVKGGGKVKVVFIVLFNEITCPLRRRQAEYRRLHEEQALHYASEEVDDDDDNRPVSPSPSTASDHIREIENIPVADWVGEVVVTVSVWRYSKQWGQAYKDGVEYTLYPDGRSEPHGVEPPCVSVQEVWGGRDTGADAREVAFRLDWGMMREHVEAARRQYAFGRKQDLEKRMGVYL